MDGGKKMTSSEDKGKQNESQSDSDFLDIDLDQLFQEIDSITEDEKNSDSAATELSSDFDAVAPESSDSQLEEISLDDLSVSSDIESNDSAATTLSSKSEGQAEVEEISFDDFSAATNSPADVNASDTLDDVSDILGDLDSLDSEEAQFADSTPSSESSAGAEVEEISFDDFSEVAVSSDTPTADSLDASDATEDLLGSLDTFDVEESQPEAGGGISSGSSSGAEVEEISFDAFSEATGSATDSAGTLDAADDLLGSLDVQEPQVTEASSSDMSNAGDAFEEISFDDLSESTDASSSLDADTSVDSAAADDLLGSLDAQDSQATEASSSDMSHAGDAFEEISFDDLSESTDASSSLDADTSVDSGAADDLLGSLDVEEPQVTEASSSDMSNAGDAFEEISFDDLSESTDASSSLDADTSVDSGAADDLLGSLDVDEPQVAEASSSDMSNAGDAFEEISFDDLSESADVSASSELDSGEDFLGSLDTDSAEGEDADISLDGFDDSSVDGESLILDAAPEGPVGKLDSEDVEDTSNEVSLAGISINDDFASASVMEHEEDENLSAFDASSKDESLTSFDDENIEKVSFSNDSLGSSDCDGAQRSLDGSTLSADEWVDPSELFSEEDSSASSESLDHDENNDLVAEASEEEFETATKAANAAKEAGVEDINFSNVALPNQVGVPAKGNSVKQQAMLQTMLEDVPSVKEQQVMGRSVVRREKTTTARFIGYLFWPFIILFGLVVLLLEIAWFAYPVAIYDKSWRPIYDSICPYLDCVLPIERDLSLIVSRDLFVRSHPSKVNYLHVTVTVTNTADYSQNFPELLFKFSDVFGDILAIYEFAPVDYAGEAYRGRLMQPGESYDVALDLYDPGIEAVNYVLLFN